MLLYSSEDPLCCEYSITQPIEPSPAITVPADLQAFEEEPRDSREYRGALAVKLALQHLPYAQICALLDVSPGFVSQHKQAYIREGVAGLALNYRGAKPLLDPSARQSVIACFPHTRLNCE